MEIENEITGIQKQILAKEEELNTVYQEKFKLKKELVNIMETIRQGECQLSKLRIEEKIAVRKYWSQSNR